jgi:hypothetical protein
MAFLKKIMAKRCIWVIYKCLFRMDVGFAYRRASVKLIYSKGALGEQLHLSRKGAEKQTHGIARGLQLLR